MASDDAIATLDKVVQDALTYFGGPGRTTSARVDRWQARDVLMHFIYFHDATAWGIQSAAQDGPPWPVPADADTVNEVSRRLHEHESLEELLTQVRQAHARLKRRDHDGTAAARAARAALERARPRVAGGGESLTARRQRSNPSVSD
ncbi:MAG: hypothetical protein DMD81_06475 [Candidatus Rokuibacteriota bacterium]|nr:MAG: hypothetical protein DMD81_06475 [Candidatus Rokubacteria bacterium]